ncbi:MAG: HD domain-containing protein [Trichocoleus desertorum ATA4-8-CV12]|jgi:(p)ppGpp synthase/HD superfamily hydrolase|nr:HD domain-containing protein [Trichocoleus desertorum ATA4-8-CV12]
MTSFEQTILTSRFEAALVYAVQLHAQQRRKVTGTPYVAHLLSVAALVLEDGGTEDEAIAALLHDAVEDQGGATTRAEISRRFGAAVVEIVDGCTEPDLQSGQGWQEHKLQYLEQIRQADPAVRRVALADKLHNARSLLVNFRLEGDGIWSQFQGGKAGVLWLAERQVELFRQVSYSGMVTELEQVVQALAWQVGVAATSPELEEDISIGD